MDHREAPLAAAVSLGPGAQSFEIQYTALSFRAPDRVRFRYRLEGLDHDWVDAGTRRTAFYNIIPPGTYRFVVRASNDDGIWNEEGASFRLELATPAWATWWARTLYALLGLAAVTTGVRYRVASLKARAEMLEAKVAERTAEIEEKVQQIAASEHRAHAASEAKGRFLAHTSHELRTPLNAILGFVQLMERTPGRSHDDQEHLAVILRSGRHLLALINDVLSLAKIEAGQQARSDEPFDVGRLVGDVESLLQLRADEKGLSLEVRIAADVPRRVVGDGGKIRQVLVNLLGNALKFTERGRVSLTLDSAGGRIRFAVADQGPGLTPEEVAALAVPFVQTQAGQAHEGTGLGLAISRSFVRLMGGDLRIESSPGVGSRFSFELELPADDSSAHPTDEAERQRRVTGIDVDGPAPVILVAEDRAEARLFVVGLLRAVGFTVVEAADGQEAVEAWRQRSPGLVLMDVGMPVLEGDAAVRQIRREEAARGMERRTVIVALTAAAFEHERERLLASGCDDFVAKPFFESTLFDVLARHLGVRYRYQAEALRPARTAVVLDGAALAAVPPDRLRALQAALSGGFVQNASEVIDQIGVDQPDVAAAMRQRMAAFQLDALESAVDAALTDQA